MIIQLCQERTFSIPTIALLSSAQLVANLVPVLEFFYFFYIYLISLFIYTVVSWCYYIRHDNVLQ